MIRSEVIADSISPAGHRLTTMVVDCHRFVLAEINTHRVFSRNSASSRAIPLAQRLEAVRTDPAMPIEWGRNQPGMQAETLFEPENAELAADLWRMAASRAADFASMIRDIGLHKQVAARILEPFLWHRIVISSTSWDGFFAQRCSPLAQPEIRAAAEAMRDAMTASTPVELAPGDWHLPFVTDEERERGWGSLRRISVARCARVSYLTEGRHDVAADLKLYERLHEARPVHASPFEHVATPAHIDDEWDELNVAGNFDGWHQLRHILGLDALLTPASYIALHTQTEGTRS